MAERPGSSGTAPLPVWSLPGPRGRSQSDISSFSSRRTCLLRSNVGGSGDISSQATACSVMQIFITGHMVNEGIVHNLAFSGLPETSSESSTLAVQHSPDLEGQSTLWLSISDSCSVPLNPVQKIFILQVFCTMVPTKCGKSRDALCLATITVGVHLPVVASRHDVLDPYQLQLCSAIDTRRIVHRLRFSNRSVEESENIDRKQQMTRLVALSNLFAL
ncbi:hypothetical protein DUI87_10403 [Hirundo rustica rustica]|uniref:Uncharacterized protein n=1 Tax=Hirundo rustica rustica TaxID=333673 RepID=A0A3M0KI04_HIRRU|nr:hypothetical protein DUI87_10403 [Hirundo rustica rustica]